MLIRISPNVNAVGWRQSQTAWRPARWLPRLRRWVSLIASRRQLSPGRTGGGYSAERYIRLPKECYGAELLIQHVSQEQDQHSLRHGRRSLCKRLPGVCSSLRGGAVMARDLSEDANHSALLCRRHIRQNHRSPGSHGTFVHPASAMIRGSGYRDFTSRMIRLTIRGASSCSRLHIA
jgi:hypothetical protein